MNIHQFDNGLYPRKLWVVVGATMGEITDSFLDDEGNELPKESLDGKVGITASVSYREDASIGVLVCVGEDCSPETMAHEAVHVASYFFSMLGIDMDTDNDEPFAYLAEWSFKCIRETYEHERP